MELMDRGVDGELVAAGVDAELEVRRQAVVCDGVTDGGHVEGHLARELRDVADVVDALVEAAAEFRGDGLDGNLLVGDGAEDDEQFGGRLRGVGLVHRDFRDEVPLPFGRSILR